MEERANILWPLIQIRVAYFEENEFDPSNETPLKAELESHETKSKPVEQKYLLIFPEFNKLLNQRIFLLEAKK